MTSSNRWIVNPIRPKLGGGGMAGNDEGKKLAVRQINKNEKFDFSVAKDQKGFTRL